jgi:hypothetical protein
VSIREQYEKETGRPVVICRTDGVHCVIIEHISTSYVEWLESRVEGKGEIYGCGNCAKTADQCWFKRGEKCSGFVPKEPSDCRDNRRKLLDEIDEPQPPNEEKVNPDCDTCTVKCDVRDIGLNFAPCKYYNSKPQPPAGQGD